MIITPHACVYFLAENMADNLNKTCKLKGRCQLISDRATCSKYTYKADIGFWDISGQYIEDVQEITEQEL